MFYKTKNQEKKSQKIDTRTCQKKKKARSKSIKEKIPATDSEDKKETDKKGALQNK